jgi:hypothetical protein
MPFAWANESEPDPLPETNYFVFRARVDEDSARISSEPKLPPRYDTWMTGQRLPIELPDPMVYSIDEPDEGTMLPYFTAPGAPLMTDELLGVFEASGVDSLDVYNAIIQETRTGKEYANYKSVNVVGLVSAADLSESEYSPPTMGEPLVDVWFEKLVLDEGRCGGQLMFRLAEAVNVVLVHKKVKELVEASQIDGLEYLQFKHPLEHVG